MRSEIDEKKSTVENLTQENERLSGNFESLKISNLHVNKSCSISETLKSLQLSNSSNRTGFGGGNLHPGSSISNKGSN